MIEQLNRRKFLGLGLAATAGVLAACAPERRASKAELEEAAAAGAKKALESSGVQPVVVAAESKQVEPTVTSTVVPPTVTVAPTATPDKLATALAENAELKKRLEAQPSATATPTRVVEAQPAVTTTATAVRVEAENRVEAYKVALPTSFRPEDNGGVQNVFLPMDKPNDNTPEVVKNRWNHYATKVEFMGNKEWVWSYDYYYADRSENLRLVQQGGEEGKFFYRQNHSETAKLVFGVGKIEEFTDSKGVTQDLHGNVKGGDPMINIRTHPGVTVRVWNPDTGERLMVDGKPLEGVTSESGDIGFVLGWKGRYLFEADLPVDTGLETIVWEGPHDRTSLKLNIFDARPGVANQAASPAESVPGKSKKLGAQQALPVAPTATPTVVSQK